MRDPIELRAREAVAHCLMRRLVVPRIYFEAAWPEDASAPFDVLAIDRDGNGDAHVIEIRRVAGDALARVPRLLTATGPYRWIAFLRGTEDDATSSALMTRKPLYPSGTAGRIGVLEVVEMTGGDLGANVVVSAERFAGSFYDLSIAFAEAHRADMQY